LRPARFAYERPASGAEALAALARHGEGAVLLAGGQSLVPMMNLRIARPAVVVDLNRCRDLAYAREEEGALVAGAMLRQGAAERDPLVRKLCPLLAAALPYVGHPPTRTRGTLGGSFAQADPVAELPGVAVALDADFFIESTQGTRRVPASEFFIAPLTTAIARGELLREIRFPIAPAGARAAFIESGNRKHDLAIAGIAAQVVIGKDGNCSDARLAAIGAADRPVRLRAAESLLNGQPLSAANVARAADAAMGEIETQGNTVASADYRRKLVGALTARALSLLNA
jgi:carbon-monoxide dehydrogenase medium subunit